MIINGKYPLPFVVQLIQLYIYEQKGERVNISLNLNDPKEKELFEKAANIVLTLHEEGML